MEACPPEVLEQIFRIACTDGGLAGRSLSAVSRYVRDVSAAVRYYSITLRGYRQIAGLSALAGTGSIRVQHLFLHMEDNVDAASGDVVLAARLLLSRLARTLETLVVIIPSEVDIGTPFDADELRALRDLTLVVPQRSFPFIRAGQDSIVGGVHPSLRRVHIVTPQRLTLNTGYYRKYAPSLTHLRMSCTVEDAQDYMQIGEHVERALEATADALWELMDPLPASTTRLLLQIASPAESADPGLAGLKPLVGALRDRAERAGGGRQLVMLENAHFPTAYDIEDTYADWLDVLGGGDGCWSAKALAAW